MSVVVVRKIIWPDSPQYRYQIEGGIGADANQGDPDTERAIFAIFRAKLDLPQDTAFEMVVTDYR